MIFAPQWGFPLPTPTVRLGAALKSYWIGMVEKGIQCLAVWDWLGIRMHMETEHRCLRVCATKTKFLQFLFAFNWNFVKFYFSLWYLQLCELLRLARSYRRNDKRSMYICCWLWLPCFYSSTKGFRKNDCNGSYLCWMHCPSALTIRIDVITFARAWVNTRAANCELRILGMCLQLK